MKKLTIIKIGNENFRPTAADLERWRNIFENTNINNSDKYNILSDGSVDIKEIELEEAEDKNQNIITLIKIGSENYNPTHEDIEKWRDLFEECAKDKDFKIFTSVDVEIEQIVIDDIIAIE